MAKLSDLSKRRLAECHPDLQRIAEEAIKGFDFVVLCGFRGKEAQDKAYHDGKSKLKFPNSKHNQTPSKAMDLAPYPIDWKDTKRFYFLAGYIKGVADRLGIKIRWGGDFNQDFNLNNDNFVDLPHFEIVD